MGGDTNNPQHPHSSGVSPPDPGSGMLHAPHFAAKNKVSFSRRGPMLAGSSLPQMGNGVGEARGVGGGDQPTPPPPKSHSLSLPSRPQHVPSASAAASPGILVAVAAVVAAEVAVRSAQCGRGAGLRAGGNGRGFPAGPGAELRGPRPRGARFRAPPDGSARCALSRFARRIAPFAAGWELEVLGGGEVGTGPSLLPSLLLSAPSRCRIASPTAKCIPAAAAGRRPTPLPPRCGSHLGDPSLCHSHISGAADEATWEPGGGQGDGNAPPNSHLFLPSLPPQLRHRSPAGGKRGPSEDCPRGAVM